MWEFPPQPSGAEKNHTRYFIEWMRDVACSPERMRRAEDALLEAEREAPELKRFRSTPQGAPWHAEGPTVAHHIKRILVGVFAVVDGESLLGIEELAREKALRGEVLELERTIRENAGTVIAYALTHDVAKPNVLAFDSPRGSKGESEGFFSHKYRGSESATEDERAHYLKLFRAFKEKIGEEDDERALAAFYDEYEIKTHFFGHDKLGASDAFEETRAVIGGSYHLSGDDLAVLHHLIRMHIDVLQYFGKKPNPAKYDTLVLRANRAGFDADDFLDLLLACVFVDACFGSLSYNDGQFYIQTDAVLNVFRTEDLVRSDRKMRRRERAELAERKRVKAALQAANLLGDGVFDLLRVPFGEERGRMMKRIRDAVASGFDAGDFGDHTDEMHRRIREAHELLTKRVRP